MAILDTRPTAITVSNSDLLHIVDISDLTDGPLGTSKKASISQIIGAILESDPVYLASPAASITDAGSGLVITGAERTAIGLNTAKVTNATHTSEVTGSTALTLAPIAVSNKPLITATGTMELLVNDAGTLKKIVASDLLGGGDNFSNANLTFAASRTHNLGGNEVILQQDPASLSGTLVLRKDAADSFGNLMLFRNGASDIGQFAAYSVGTGSSMYLKNLVGGTPNNFLQSFETGAVSIAGGNISSFANVAVGVTTAKKYFRVENKNNTASWIMVSGTNASAGDFGLIQWNPLATKIFSFGIKTAVNGDGMIHSSENDRVGIFTNTPAVGFHVATDTQIDGGFTNNLGANQALFSSSSAIAVGGGFKILNNNTQSLNLMKIEGAGSKSLNVGIVGTQGTVTEPAMSTFFNNKALIYSTSNDVVVAVNNNFEIVGTSSGLTSSKAGIEVSGSTGHVGLGQAPNISVRLAMTGGIIMQAGNFYIKDTGTPGTPTGGGKLFSSLGVPKWREPSGTVYDLANIGFTGTGAYTNFTIVNGLITAAS